MAGHLSERAQWIDRIVVSKQQHRLSCGGTRKIYLQVIAKTFCLVNANFPAEPRKFIGDGLGHAIDGGFVVAGRFDFSQIADSRNNLVAAVAEITQPQLGFRSLVLGRCSEN